MKHISYKMLSKYGPGGRNCNCCGPCPSHRKAHDRAIKRAEKRMVRKRINEEMNDE